MDLSNEPEIVDLGGHSMGLLIIEKSHIFFIKFSFGS
jgi:hypothetical protein